MRQTTCKTKENLRQRKSLHKSLKQVSMNIFHTESWKTKNTPQQGLTVTACLTPQLTEITLPTIITVVTSTQQICRKHEAQYGPSHEALRVTLVQCTTLAVSGIM